VLFDEILLCKKQSSSKTIKLCVLYFDFVEKNGKLKITYSWSVWNKTLGLAEEDESNEHRHPKQALHALVIEPLFELFGAERKKRVAIARPKGKRS